MMENPFFNRGAIRDPVYFYNRKTEVRRALEMLCRGQSVSVIGPRKIGKTSFLLYLSNLRVMQEYGLDPSHCLFVYFNCEGLGNLDRQALYALILREIVERAAQQGLNLHLPPVPDSHIGFDQAIGAIINKNLRITLLFDEFETVSTNKNLDAEFFSGLRALTTRFDIAYMTVSQRPLLSLPNTHEYSPFFNIFVTLKLCLFDTQGSEDLIHGSLRKAQATLAPKVVELVLELGGGHPFFLQVAGYWALELQAAKGSPLEPKDFRILTQAVRGQIESHFEYYWRHLTPQEQYALITLPLIQGQEIYREHLMSLASLCLIAECNGHYRYFSPLFRDFVRRQIVDHVLQAGPVTLDLKCQRGLLREEPLELSSREFALLKYLMQHQGQVVSNEELDREVLASTEEQPNYVYAYNEERLKSAIRELRKALGDETIRLVNQRGVGYMLQIPTEE